MNMPDLPDLTVAQARASRAVALRDALDGQIAETGAEISRLEDEETLLELVGNLIRRLIDVEVTDGVKAVEKLQTEGLRTVFHDQDLSVRAEVEESRGKVAVTLLTGREREDGVVVEGVPEESFGGSVLTMQSILMRVTVIFRHGLRPLLLLDETMSAVANKYVDRAARFLSTLCKRLDLDVLLITHDEALVSAAKRAYYITYEDDKANFTEVSSSTRREEGS